VLYFAFFLSNITSIIVIMAIKMIAMIAMAVHRGHMEPFSVFRAWQIYVSYHPEVLSAHQNHFCLLIRENIRSAQLASLTMPCFCAREGCGSSSSEMRCLRSSSGITALSICHYKNNWTNRWYNSYNNTYNSIKKENNREKTSFRLINLNWDNRIEWINQKNTMWYHIYKFC
jgi:hypothetical protein